MNWFIAWRRGNYSVENWIRCLMQSTRISQESLQPKTGKAPNCYAEVFDCEGSCDSEGTTGLLIHNILQISSGSVHFNGFLLLKGDMYKKLPMVILAVQIGHGTFKHGEYPRRKKSRMLRPLIITQGIQESILPVSIALTHSKAGFWHFILFQKNLCVAIWWKKPKKIQGIKCSVSSVIILWDI